MCICWCVAEINYKMHCATIKIGGTFAHFCTLAVRPVAIAVRYDFLEWQRSAADLRATVAYL